MRHPFVIVRAFDDEPVKLRCVGIRGRSVDCVGTDPQHPMPSHLYRTYCFNKDLFAKLRAAYGLTDRSELMRLWDTAEPFGDGA